MAQLARREEKLEEIQATGIYSNEAGSSESEPQECDATELDEHEDCHHQVSLLGSAWTTLT